MRFKVPASREEIGDSLDKCSVNCDISPNLPLFTKGEKEIRLLLEGEGLWAESRKQSACARLDDEI